MDDKKREKEEQRRILMDLFEAQTLAVLATHRDGQPYCSLVAFVATEDLAHLLFATNRLTRKFRNLSADPRAAMLIDSRGSHDPFRHAVAVTATGVASEVDRLARDNVLKVYLARHPYLEEFAIAPSCALLWLHVEGYSIVTNFQHVSELRIREIDPGFQSRC